MADVEGCFEGPRSVVQPWLSRMGWKLQSIFFSGLRGPDAPNVPAVKAVNRWMRTVSQHNADPSKDYMRADELPTPYELCDELEFLPVHYVHHLADALAVIAYGHPNPDVARPAADYHYRIAEELLHFVPEAADVFLLRHRDKPQGRDPVAQDWADEVRRSYRTYMEAALVRFNYRA